MIVVCVRLIYAVGIFILSGLVLLRYIDRVGQFSWGVRLAISFMLGLGVVSFQMFAYSVSMVSPNVLNISAPWIILAILTWTSRNQTGATEIGDTIPISKSKLGHVPDFLQRAFSMAVIRRGLPSLHKYGWFGIILFGIIASQVCYALVCAPLLPLSGWDAWANWFFKAKVFFMDGRVVSTHFVDSTFILPEYPLLVPLSAAWVYTCLGKVNDQWVKIIYPLQYLSMLVIFYYLVKRLISRPPALLFTALLSLTPIVMVHGGSFTEKIATGYSGDLVGYADLPLAIYILGAAGFLCLFVVLERSPYLLTAVLFCGMAAWTKNEGLVFACVCGGLIVWHLATKSRTPIVSVLMAGGILGSLLAPWLIYKTYLNLTSVGASNMALSAICGNIGRLPIVLKGMACFMFYSEHYNFCWYAYAGSSLLKWRNLFERPVLFMNVLLLAQLGFYVVVSIVLPLETVWFISTSIDRTLLAMVPLAMLITAVNLYGQPSLAPEKQQRK